MKVPTYQNQVSPGRINTAEPRTGTPVSEAFGTDMARAASNLGQGTSRLATEISASAERALTRQKNLRTTAAQLNWRKDNDELLNGRIDPDTGTRIEGGLLTKTYGDAKDIAKIYQQKGRELMQKYLASAQTPEEREELALAFEEDFQKNFDQVARHQYKQERDTDDLLTKTYGEQQAGLAGAITTVPDMRRNLDETYAVFNKNAQANGMPEEAQRLQRYGVANTNVSSSVKGALSNGNIAGAREVLEGVKDDLLPDDYNALNFLITKAEEESQKEHKNNALYQQAIINYQSDPEALVQEIQVAKRNPFAFQQTLAERGINVSPKEIVSYISWAEKLADDPQGRIGQARIQNFQNWSDKYAGFEIDEKKLKIKNKDLNNPGNLVAAINATRASISAGDFTEADAKKAQEKITLMRKVLGTMDITPKSIGSETVGGSIVRQIQLLTDGGKVEKETGDTIKLPIVIEDMELPYYHEIPNKKTYEVDPILLPEEKGMLIEDTFARLQEAGINLETEKAEEKETARAIMQHVVRRYLQQKFVPDYDDVSQIQYGDNIISSYAVKPNPNLGAKLNANYDKYRLEVLNGVRRLVRRDEKGNIIHSQLY